MNYLKKLGLVCAAIAFLMSISVVTGYAQWSRNRSWQNRDNYSSRQYRNRRTENNRRWQNRSSYWNNRSNQSRYYRYGSYGTITRAEAIRLQRQRARLLQARSRYYYNDGRLSYRERRRLAERYQRYRRSVYRDRRDW